LKATKGGRSEAQGEPPEGQGTMAPAASEEADLTHPPGEAGPGALAPTSPTEGDKP